MVQVVVCVWIVETFGETVDEYARVGALDVDGGVGAITMVEREEDSTGKGDVDISRECLSISRCDVG